MTRTVSLRQKPSCSRSVEVTRNVWRGEQLVDALRARERGVDLESELRHEPHADAPRKLAAQEALMLVEMLDRILGAFAAKGQNVDGGELQVRRHAHFRNGQRIAVEHVVDDLAAGEDFGERM